jgi:hypothetical protein
MVTLRTVAIGGGERRRMRRHSASSAAAAVAVVAAIVTVLALMVFPGISFGNTTGGHGGSPSDVFTQTNDGTCVTVDKNGGTAMTQPLTLGVDSNILVHFSFEWGRLTSRLEGHLNIDLDGASSFEWGFPGNDTTTRTSGTVTWSFDDVTAGEHTVDVGGRVDPIPAGGSPATGRASADVNDCALTVFVVPADGPNGENTSVPIGVGHVELNQHQVGPDSYQVSAFVPTGSSHDGCLVTLAESDFATAGETVFCGIRHFDGQDGVVIHIFLPQAAPPEFTFVLSVYQPFAQGYGEPVYFDGS